MSHVTAPEAWGFRPHDLLSIGLWNLGRCKEALAALDEALDLAPNAPRLVNNRRIMIEHLEKTAWQG